MIGGTQKNDLFYSQSNQVLRKENAMRHPAPLFYLLTLFIITKTRIIQFSQDVKATLGLSAFSDHLPTITKIGGMNGGMKLLIDADISGNANQGVV